MAYASLVSLEHTSGLILNHDKYSASFAEREQITSILEYVSFLISFFEDLPEKAKRLEGKIMDLAHKAEDLMEYHMWNQCQTKWPLAAAGPSKNTYERQLKEVREKIGSFTGEMMEDRASVLQFHHHHGVGASRKDKVVIGLDADLREIKGQLCGESSKLEVIPIVGMGGIGKTALAQHLYDDPLIVERFDIRVWVTVSQDYSFDQIVQTLGHAITFLKCTIKPVKSDEDVYKSLKGRRYLIVMDDIWSTNAWDAVRYIFPDDNNGSRIMLTTRLSDVASYASSGGPVHEMKFMDEKQSWNLLKHRVFTDDEECSPELEDIGKGIARGCRGLPLAVVLVAGVLSTMVKTRASWEKIAKDLNAVFDEQCDKILSLSYMFLPHHLRPCFLFLAAFPEDHNIQVSRLVKLWVAEGFLRQCNGNNRLEEEAEGYLEDLVKRSLVLVASRKSNGKMKSCRVHDLVRDMCIRIAQEEKFLVAGKYVVPSGSNEERRISIGRLNRLDMIRCPTVHTILFMNDTPSLDLVVNFRLLRVLEVIHNRQVFHPAVFKLFHLRYLAVRISNENLQGISNLENLQTLILYPKYYALRYWDEVRSYLPLEIWRMQQLRHLVLPNGYGLPMPADVLNFPLHNLQTLSGIPSSQRKRIFEMIPNLKKNGHYTYNERT